jgi:hypothetical protein
MAREFLINTIEFRTLYGEFMVTWNVLDLTTDLAIGRFLNITDQEAHLMTSGLMYGRKARLLRDLINRSNHPRKAAILGALNNITSEGKREAIVHSYVHGSADVVEFVERSISGPYTTKRHKFTLNEFRKHVESFYKQCMAFHNALGYSTTEIEAFGEAATSASRKAAKSPQPPDSTAK